jgi:ribosomal protein S18 acetylase RimI-like enzyme
MISFNSAATFAGKTSSVKLKGDTYSPSIKFTFYSPENSATNIAKGLNSVLEPEFESCSHLDAYFIEQVAKLWNSVGWGDDWREINSYINESSGIITVWNGDKLVGLAMIEQPNEKGEAYLKSVVVDSKYQNNDIGKNMVKYLLDFAARQKAKKVTLETYYRRAFFYNKLGFKVTKVDNKNMFPVRMERTA